MHIWSEPATINKKFNATFHILHLQENEAYFVFFVLLDNQQVKIDTRQRVQGAK